MDSSVTSAVFSFIAISVICSCVTLAIGETPFKGLLKTVSALLLLLSFLNVLLPISNFIKEGFDYGPGNTDGNGGDVSISDDLILNEAEKQLCLFIKDLISERFDIDKVLFDVSVSLDINDISNVKIDAVTVTLYGNTECSPHEISLFIEYTLACKCTVLNDQEDG